MKLRFKVVDNIALFHLLSIQDVSEIIDIIQLQKRNDWETSQKFIKCKKKTKSRRILFRNHDVSAHNDFFWNFTMIFLNIVKFSFNKGI